ncbi:hypothetical protein Tco_1352113 [Tanacetum coccineum]
MKRKISSMDVLWFGECFTRLHEIVWLRESQYKVESCFFDIQLTNLSPRNYIPPEVLLRISIHPAWECHVDVKKAQEKRDFTLLSLTEQAQTSHQWIASLAIRVSDHMIQGP